MFYKKLENKQVQCVLCPRNCIIVDGCVGNFGVRRNTGGTLFSEAYGRIVSMAVDPIEKKPLLHFRPGSKTLSIATVGCNFHCTSCQNFDVSQPKKIIGEKISPAQVVALAKKHSEGISYTYTEPTIFYEFMLDTAKLARKEGLYNVLVTNGYINPEPLKKLAPFIDAANVDVKSMKSRFYQKLCKAPSEKPPLETVELIHKLGIHVEVTNLVIPGENDSKEDFHMLCAWLAGIDKNIPLHFSRYFPAYLMNAPPTPLEILALARNIATEHGIKHVHIGNVDESEMQLL
ncbi:MAG: AmmeMemoRadiSam system radical SAM enzyme [Candidatus Aenigmarchaeota archaeon]|nr:AmmeMemoRadiSam system radical SAM enzyme [Candidatus Aenigmarchaeota archaeon]